MTYITLANGRRVPVKVRQLTLNEDFDSYGRLIQYLGTNVPSGPGPAFGLEYLANPTEVVRAGSYEIWEIANLTGDTHPIHFHLVNVQILSRQAFDAANYTGIPRFTAGPTAPDFNELGWKETVRMNPGQVTRVLMKFDLPAVPFTVPASPRTGGNEYVWHCHILEHEEHDMMRPLVVV
jgi:spore coat protein A